MAVKPIPGGIPRVSPYLIVNDVGKTIDFLKEVFDTERSEISLKILYPCLKKHFFKMTQQTVLVFHKLSGC
jgi:hypothetical protein